MWMCVKIKIVDEDFVDVGDSNVDADSDPESYLELIFRNWKC